MKKINFRIALLVFIFTLCGENLFAQTDKRLKIEPQKINSEALKNPQEMPVNPTRRVRDAFYAYFGRTPNSKEAKYWNAIGEQKSYTHEQFVDLIKTRFTAPKNYTADEEKAHKEEIRAIIERAFKAADKPEPATADLDKWAISIAFGKDWFRTIRDSFKSK